MLSAESISGLVARGELRWSGQLRGDGLLLTLGSPLQPLSAPASEVVDLADQSSIDTLYDPPVAHWATYDLAPGDVLLAPVGQPLRLGSAVMGMIGGLSHLARVGLSVHVTSPFVLPGWNGHLTLELVNTAPAVLRLHHGMPVGRLLLFSMDDGRPRADHPAHSFYGRSSALTSHYADEFAVGRTWR